MCGIMGWSFNPNCTLTMRQRATLLMHGAFGADKRGGQSWGTLTLDGTTPSVSRGMGALVQRNFRKLASRPFGFAHSRYATHGGISIANCHPFEIGNIIGAHNGVLSNARELDKLFGDKAVDSMHIFERIDKGEPLTALEGYGVIEFYDRRYSASLFLADIGKGSITVWELKAGGYFWCSLQEDGELALEAVGAEAEEVRIHEGKVYSLQNGGEMYECKDMKLELGGGHYHGYQATGFTAADWSASSDWRSDYRQPWRGKSTYDVTSGKWDDDTGEFPPLTKEELKEIHDEAVADFLAERKEEAQEEADKNKPAAIVEKEWTIGGTVQAKAENKPETEEKKQPIRLIVAS